MGSLSGTVTENGVPVPNVNISIEDTIFSASTNTNGEYDFSFAPIGTHTVTASKPGYTPVSHTVTIVEDQDTVQDFVMVGTPDIAISDSEWNFGDVNLGGENIKGISITNMGGGNLGITDISIAGSTTFALLDLPALPATLTSEQSIDFAVSFTPNSLGEATATITITDDQGTRHVLANKSSSGLSTRGSNTREVHTITLIGNGVNDITIGDGSQNERVPLDMFYKTSLFETIYTAAEMNNFIGLITGLVGQYYSDGSGNWLDTLWTADPGL
jgi:hypothetical protein